VEKTLRLSGCTPRSSAFKIYNSDGNGFDITDYCGIAIILISNESLNIKLITGYCGMAIILN